MGGQMINKTEKLLVLESRTKEDFAKKYIEKFGMPSKLYRIDNIWTQRETFRKELGKPNIEAVSKVTTGIVPRMSNAMADEGEVLSHISNKLSELIQIQKETFLLFKKLDKTPEGMPNDKTGGSGNG
jgi:hypothetical protein